MSDSHKKKTEKLCPKLPDIKMNYEEQYRQKQLTDPPMLKKANLKPISNYTSEKSDQMAKLVDIFQRTQTQFSHIYKQILAITERQESFNSAILQRFQHLNNGNQRSGLNYGSSPDTQLRYRYFLIQIPVSEGSKINLEKMKKWLRNVVSQTFSVTFHRFSKSQLTFEQAKVYSSSNILRNLVFLCSKTDISITTLQALEQQMGRLLRYLQLKYPLTESTQINKALQGTIQEVDNMGLLAHNYFATSQIVFEFRQGGNYNDLIMNMLNDIFSKIDERSPYEKCSNFTQFKKIMTNIFQSIEEEQEQNYSIPAAQQQLMPGLLDFITDRYVKAKSTLREPSTFAERAMKDSSKIRQEKEKYKNKIRQYTHYAIGRKIPQNFQSYTDKEIESMNLTIKTPAVLRILTKWAQQLRNKFRTPDYFASLTDGIKSQKGGTVHSLLFSLRRTLDEEMSKEQLQIQKFLKSSGRDNLDLKLKLMKKQLGRSAKPLGNLQLQQICGRYSIQTLSSLHSHLIAYLNRLIHGLTSVSKNFYERVKSGVARDWQFPPDLVTFTLGDLLRCKISSREREILRIYQQLKFMSYRNPQKLKIIRVKNRLSKTTNDILVNVRFNNLITAQIQLAVKVETSEFIKCSNTFCHFLYELERSPFGAIAELCNVWAAFDRTAQSFKQMLDSEALRQTPIRTHACLQSQLLPYDRSFICHTCQVVYYQNNYLRSHMQCQQCKEFICAKCLLRKEDPQHLKALLICNRTLRADCKQLIQRLDTSENLTAENVPEFGVCISIERRQPNVEIFRNVQHGNLRFILGIKGGEIYEVQRIQSNKQLAIFLRKYIIFRLDPNTGENHIKLTSQIAIQKFILPKIFSSSYKKAKQTLVIGQKLTSQILQNSLKVVKSEGKDKIRKIFLDSNRLQRVNFIANEFPNLVLLQLSFNPIQSLDGLSSLSYLKSLSLAGCELKVLHDSIFTIKSLQELKLYENKLSNISGIGQLTQLKLLDLSNNNIEKLPDDIGKCTQLIILRAENNVISQLTTKIQFLKELRGLNLCKNEINTLPIQIGHLVALQQLELRENQLTLLPQEFGKLFNLQKLDLSSNKLTSIPAAFQDLQFLRYLNLSNNQLLKTLPHQLQHLTQLLQLNLSGCGFQSLPFQVCSLIFLKELNISRNKLTSLPSLDKLNNVINLFISHNKLASDLVHDHFAKLAKLQHINLSYNNLTRVPNFFYCERLCRINLSYNNIKEVNEDDIEGLDTLQQLKLDHNRLQVVADGLLMLPKLKQLNLSTNKLKKVGGSKAVLPSLLKINLSENQLIEVPSCLLQVDPQQVSHISSIDVSCNQIEELPPQLTQLKNLKTFKCNRNNLKQLTSQLQRFMWQKKFDNDVKDIKAAQQASPLPRKTFSRSGVFRKM